MIIIIAALFSLFHQLDGGVVSKEKSIFNFTGQCEKGTVYTIRDESDLLDTLRPQLECVYQAGLVPTQVITGSLKGKFLAVLNQADPLTSLFDLGWDGKTIKEVNCEEGKTIYFGWNTRWSMERMAPFIARIGEIKDTDVEEGEYLDHRPTLLFDYTPNFLRAGCTREYLVTLATQGQLIPPFNHYPLSDIMDALRLVGRGLDGGNIYLGKGYLRDPLSRKFRTVMYFSDISYEETDISINRGLEVGESLPPLPNSFKFSIQGLDWNK